MAHRVSIIRAQDAPPFVVYSEDQVVGRFGSLGAAFEAAQAAAGEINQAAAGEINVDERSWVVRWLLGARRARRRHLSAL